MIRIGPAGWSYEDWEGIVYPPGKGKKFDPLPYLAEFFETIEINNTFYRAPSAKMVKGWVRRIEGNPDFRFTAKLYRLFTHERKNITEADEVAFKDGLNPLLENARLGALLLQFPYSFHFNSESLSYLSILIKKFRAYPLVFEARHASWDRAAAYRFLREENVGFCNIDQPQVSYSLGATRKVTSELGYLRLHGRNTKDWFREGAGRDARYDYLYNEFEIFELLERIRQIAKEAKEIFVITNNHYRGKAICNALELKRKLGQKIPQIPDLLLTHYPQLLEAGDSPEKA